MDNATESIISGEGSQSSPMLRESELRTVSTNLCQSIVYDLVDLVVETMAEEENEIDRQRSFAVVARSDMADRDLLKAGDASPLKRPDDPNDRKTSEQTVAQKNYFQDKKEDRFFSTDQPPNQNVMNIKKKIFVKNRQYSKNRVESSVFQSTRHSSNPADIAGHQTSTANSADLTLQKQVQPDSSAAATNKKSALSEFLSGEMDDSENDFQLTAPDKLLQKNLFITVRFSIGGKVPLFIECDLSKRHTAKDVIRHLLTQYRRNKEVRERHKFTAPLDEPAAFELRHIEDDSDSDFSDDLSQRLDDPRDKFFKPDMDLKGLDPDQPIGGFDKLVLVEKKNWQKLKDKMKKAELAFLKEVPQKEQINVPGHDIAQDTRLFYVIIQCIPIPLMMKFTSSNSIIVPVVLKK